MFNFYNNVSYFFSCYGKFIQSDKNRIDVTLCTDPAKAQRLLNDPLFTGFRIVNESVVAVFRRQKTIKMKGMYHIGFSILELSKLHMYKTYYNVLQPHFGHENIELLFSDTDSFALKIKSRNLEDDLKKLEVFFDFSNFPKNHFLYNDNHQNEVG